VTMSPTARSPTSRAPLRAKGARWSCSAGRISERPRAMLPAKDEEIHA
jgi:hypothetical protein